MHLTITDLDTVAISCGTAILGLYNLVWVLLVFFNPQRVSLGTTLIARKVWINKFLWGKSLDPAIGVQCLRNSMTVASLLASASIIVSWQCLNTALTGNLEHFDNFKLIMVAGFLISAAFSFGLVLRSEYQLTFALALVEQNKSTQKIEDEQDLIQRLQLQDLIPADGLAYSFEVDVEGTMGFEPPQNIQAEEGEGEAFEDTITSGPSQDMEFKEASTKLLGFGEPVAYRNRKKPVIYKGYDEVRTMRARLLRAHRLGELSSIGFALGFRSFIVIIPIILFMINPFYFIGGSLFTTILLFFQDFYMV